MQTPESYTHSFKYVTAQAALDWANYCFAHGARTAIADFLEAMSADGVDLGDPQVRANLVAELRAENCPKHN